MCQVVYLHLQLAMGMWMSSIPDPISLMGVPIGITMGDFTSMMEVITDTTILCHMIGEGTTMGYIGSIISSIIVGLHHSITSIGESN